MIEGANLWEGYSRAVYLSSAMCAREPSGGRVQINPTSPVKNLNDAITIAVHRVDPRLRNQSGPWQPRQEPDWGSQLAICLAELGASNLPKIQRALGLEPEALNHMRALRNFFAHKGIVSVRKARKLTTKYGLRNEPDPIDFLLSPARGKPGYEPGEVIVLRWFEVLCKAIQLTVDPVPGSP